MFSIIIPVFNKPNTINHSVASVLSQTYCDFELHIVDDGSTMPVEPIVRSFTSDFRIKYHQQKNSGVSIARNTGIRCSNGNYICFLDADDVWLPNHLQTLHELIVKYPDAGMFVTSHKTISTSGEEYISNSRLKFLREQDFLTKNFLKIENRTHGGIINTNSVCIKKSILENEKLYFEPGEKLGEDTDLWYRVAINHSVALSKNVTTCYRRIYSDATRNGFNPENWIFARRVDEHRLIYPNKSIYRQVNILVDRYKYDSVRRLFVKGNKKKAIGIIRTIKYKFTFVMLANIIFLLLPKKIQFKILN